MGALSQEQLQKLIAEEVGKAVGAALQTRSAETSAPAISPVEQMLSGNINNEYKAQPQYKRERAKGEIMGSFVRALAAGRGDPERATKYAALQFGAESPVTKALAAGSSTAGGFLVPEEFSTELIELLRPASVVRSLNPQIIPMNGGTLRIPRMTGGASASYIGENTNIPPSQPSFGQLTLSWKKLAALVPVSNDLLRFSNPSADQIIRDDLVAAMAQREDQAFIRDDGTQNTPKGLRYWAPVANVIDASTLGFTDPKNPTFAEVLRALGRLRLVMRQANARMLRLGMLMSPRTEQYLMNLLQPGGNAFAFQPEMMNGTMYGIPFRVTTQIPENLGASSDASEIYFVDFADVVIGESTTLTLDTSTEAAYHDGSNVVAAFSLDQTVIRAIAEHDMVVRYDPAVVVLSVVRWGAP
jgi:HK97 family phage major capsid protein